MNLFSQTSLEAGCRHRAGFRAWWQQYCILLQVFPPQKKTPRLSAVQLSPASQLPWEVGNKVWRVSKSEELQRKPEAGRCPERGAWEMLPAGEILLTIPAIKTPPLMKKPSQVRGSHPVLSDNEFTGQTLIKHPPQTGHPARCLRTMPAKRGVYVALIQMKSTCTVPEQSVNSSQGMDSHQHVSPTVPALQDHQLKG